MALESSKAWVLPGALFDTHPLVTRAGRECRSAEQAKQSRSVVVCLERGRRSFESHGFALPFFPADLHRPGGPRLHRQLAPAMPARSARPQSPPLPQRTTSLRRPVAACHRRSQRCSSSTWATSPGDCHVTVMPVLFFFVFFFAGLDRKTNLLF